MDQLEAQKTAINVARQSQRNWDHSKPIPEEHIEHFIYLLKNAPSKQDEAYYNVYAITDRGILQSLFDHTWGYTILPIPGVVSGVTRNPQMNASAYFLFVSKPAPTVREFWIDGGHMPNEGQPRRDNQSNAIGIAAGILAFCAASLGYRIGFNKNHGQDNSNSNEIWCKTLGVRDDESIEIGVGIGFPRSDMDRNQTDDTEFLVGPYPSTKHSIHDETITWQGETYPNVIKKIEYLKLSDHPKDIRVTRI